MVTFALMNVLAEPNAADFPTLLYRDNDCSGGEVDAGDTEITGPIHVLAGTEVCLIVHVQVAPGTPPDASYSYNLTAITVPAITAATLPVLLNHDVLQMVPTGTVQLIKQVRDVTTGGTFGLNSTAAPGDTLEYVLLFTNPSSESVSNVSLQDRTPDYTTLHMTGTGTVIATPAGMPCVLTIPPNPANDGYSGPLEWDCTGTMLPGDGGKIAFQVRVAK